MALTNEQQVLEAVNRSKNILVAFRKTWSVDACATALALGKWIGQKGKKVTIVCDGFTAPNLGFLPGVADIRGDFGRNQAFVVSVDIAAAGIEELSYDVDDTTLRIRLVPKRGQFAPHQVTSAPAALTYDLVILVGTPDLPSLGGLFERLPDLFFKTPTVNLDYHPSNERHGNIDAVNIAAASCAETAFGIIRAGGTIDEDIATCLLAGMTAETRSFRSPTVSPRTLEIAAELIAAGARRGEIMQGMYRTRTVAALKLWGRALSRLKHDEQLKFAWTSLVRQDFTQTGAGEEQLPDVIEELVANAPDAETVAVIYEENSASSQKTKALIYSSGTSALGLVAVLRPQPAGRFAFCDLDTLGVVEAERKVAQTVRDGLRGTPAKTVPPPPPLKERQPPAGLPIA